MQSLISILVVDDDPQLLRGTCRLLEQAGYSTRPAATGTEALEILRTDPPHLVLLDRQLPDADGLEICRQIKANPATADVVFVVLVSGHFVQDEAQAEGLETGADGYIARPVGNRELLARVAAFARIARLTRKLKEEASARRHLEAELEQRVAERTAKLTATSRKLDDARRAAFTMMEDANAAQKQLTSTNLELRREITARRQEQALSQTVIDSIPGTFYMLDAQGNYVRWNAYQRDMIVGRPEAEMAGVNALTTIHPDDRALIQERIANVLVNGAEEIIEGRVLLRGGPDYQWLLMTGRRLMLAGSPFLIGIGIDLTKRKRAEAAVRGSEARYRLLAENGSDVIWLLDLRTQRFTYTSPAVLKMRGFTPEEVRQHTLADTLTPESCQKVATLLPARLAAFAAGDDSVRTQTNELDMFHRDGSVVHTEVVTTLITDEHRQVTHIQGVTRDLTERRQAEDALLKSAEQTQRLNEILLAIRDINGLLNTERDRQKLLTGVCQSLLHTRDYVMVWVGEPDEATGEVRPTAYAGPDEGWPLHVPIRWDDSPLGSGPTGTALRERHPVVFNDLATDPRFAPWRDSAVAAGAASIASVPLLHHDHVYGTLTVKANRTHAFNLHEVELLNDLAGEVARALSALATEAVRQRAESELRASEERFRAYIEQAADAVFVHDDAGRFVDVNERACQSLGYSRTELLQIGVLDIEAELSADSLKASWEQATPGQRYTEIASHRRKDGTTFPVEITFGALDLRGRKLFLCLSRDITERRQVEQRSNLLRELGFALTRSTDLTATLRLCLDTAIKVSGMDAGGIYLAEEATGDIRLECHSGLSEEFTSAVSHFPADSVNARWAREGEIFHSHVTKQDRPASPAEAQEGLRALSLLPVRYAGRLLAVLNVTSHTADEVTPAARVALETVAGLLGGLLHRLRAKEELQASAGRMRALLASMDDLVFVLDRNLVFQEYHQPPTAELFVAPEFFYHKRLEEIGFPEPALSIIKDALTRTLETGTTNRAEYWLDRPLGRMWFDMQVTAFRSEGAQPTGLTCVVRNITSGKQAAAALQESERQIAALMSNLPGMAYRCRNDRDWTMEFVSEGCQSLTGYSAAALTGNTEVSYADLIHPDDRETVWNEVQQALARSEHFELHYRVKTAAGETRWVWEQGLGVYSADGALLGLEGFILDITVQRQAIAALREREAQLRLALDAGRAITWEWDIASDTIHYPSNSAAFSRGEDQTPFSSRENLAQQIHPDDRELVAEAFRRSKEEGVPFDCDHRVRLLDGVYHWVMAKGQATKDDAGQVVRVAGVLMDITEQRQREAVTAARARLLNLAAGQPMDALLRTTLDEAEQLTDSRIGFYHFLQPDQITLTLQVWSTNTTKELCQAEGAGRHYPVDQAGVWVDCLRQGEPVIHNDYASLPHRKGLPPGHAEVTRMLVVPVKRGDKIVALLGVGNKPSNYLQADIDTVAALADLAWDITERKQAETKLKETAYLLEEAQRTARVGYYATDLATGHWDTSPMLDEIFGIGPDFPRDIPNWGRLIHPDDRAKALQHYEEAASGNGQFRLDYRLIRPSDGALCWMAAFGQVEYGLDGEPKRLVGCIQDITERKQAELALQQLNMELEQRVRERTTEALDLYHHAPCGYHSVGLDGVVLQMNDTELGWLGYAREEVEGRMHFSDLMMPASAALFDERFREFREVSGSGAWEWEMRCRDGSSVFFLVNAGALRDAAGQFVRSRSTVLNITERKRLELALQEQEENFHAIFDTSRDAIVTADAAGQCVDCNPAAVALFGFPDKAALLAGSLLDLAPVRQPDGRESRDCIAEKMAEIMSMGGASFAWSHRRADGTVFPSEVSIALTEVWGRKLLHGIVRDVSERRRAEERLRESARRHLDLVETMPDWVWEVDAQGVYTFAGPQCLALIGYTPEEVLGKTPFDFFSPEEAVRLAKLIQPIMERGEPIRSLENTICRRDGRLVTVETNGVPIRNAAGKLLGYRGLDHDITERKRLENILHESEEKFRVLFESSRDAIITTDLDGRCLDCNSAAVKMYGAAGKADVLARGPMGFSPARQPNGQESGPAFGAHIAQALARGSHFCEWWHQQPDGTTFPAEISISVAQIGGQTVLQGIVHDITARRAAEHQLRESEERFRSIVESSPMAMYFYRLEATGRLTMTGANPTADKIIGIAHQELLGKSIEEAFPNLAQTEVPEMYRNVASGKIGAQQFEVPYGDARFTGYYSVHVFRTGQRTIAVNFFDISARRKAEEALKENEEKYRLLFENAGDAILIHDDAGQILATNEVAEKRLDYTREELLRMNVGQVDSPGESHRAPERIAQLMQQGSLTFETVHQRKDGSLFPAEVSARRVSWNGQPAMMSIVRDLTERRRAETQVRKLQSAVEYSPLAVVITDTKGNIEYVNPRFETQTGYPPEEVLGKNPRLLGSGTHPREFFASLWQTLRAGHTWNGEICNKKKDGTIIWEATAIAPIRDSENRLTHFVAIKEDITERRRLQEELHHAKEAAEVANVSKSRFLANMSHEIRTPLNSVLGFSQLLQRDTTLTPQQTRHLSTINRNGEYLLRLINDVLDMSKIEASRVQLTLVDFDLRTLLDDMDSVFRLRTDGKGLHFTVQVGTEVPTVLNSDAGKIRQVIFNLLGNAVKFTARGSITVRATTEPAPIVVTGEDAVRVNISITDTGPGIAPEDCERVFEPFEQTRIGQNQGGGSGLGLTISRHLAHMMGGDVSLTSQLGVGSTFHFSFIAMVPDPSKVALAGPLPPRRVISLEPGTPAPRVLVVDDSESNRELLRCLLEGVGFVVNAVSDGFAAVDHCQTDRPALILMDRRMPGMDGLAATRAIRAGPAGKGPCILMVSADVLSTSDDDCKGVGVDGFIAKPFNNTDLLLQIGKLLGVNYLCETAVVAEPAPRVAIPRAVADLPAELRTELLQATESGDGARLQKLIAEVVKPRQPALAEMFSQWATQYNYAAILKALRGNAE